MRESTDEGRPVMGSAPSHSPLGRILGLPLLQVNERLWFCLWFLSLVLCLWLEPLWRIDTAAVKRSDPRNALQLRTQTPDDFTRGFAEVDRIPQRRIQQCQGSAQRVMLFADFTTFKQWCGCLPTLLARFKRSTAELSP